MSAKRKTIPLTEAEIMHQVETFGYIFALSGAAPLSTLKMLVRQGKLREVDKTRGWSRFVAMKTNEVTHGG